MTERKYRSHSRKSVPRGKEITRREFFGFFGNVVVTVAGTIVFGGGAAWYVLDHLSQISEVDAKLADYKDKEQKLEPIITRFEKGFQRFSGLVSDKLATANFSAAEKRALAIPFELAEINRRNPDRNVYTFKRRDLEARRTLTSVTVPLNNPNYFFFGFEPAGSGAVGSFGPTTKTFNISAAYNPDNVLDNLIAFHELVHVAQDNMDRSELPSDKYMAFFADAEKRRKLKVVGLYEATAYAEEIALLNLLTDGQFKNEVLGREINLPKYRLLLRSRPEQDGVIAFLGQLAYQFYNSRSSLTGIDGRFVDYINNIYRQNGAEVYDRTPSGFVPAK